MTYSGTVLKQIIEESFDGKNKLLAEATKLTPPVVSKLLKGQTFTPQTLETVCSALTHKDAVKLCRAACYDMLPEEYAQEILTSSPAGVVAEPVVQFPALDDETEAALQRFRNELARDPLTRSWLHRMDTWSNPDK